MSATVLLLLASEPDEDEAAAAAALAEAGFAVDSREAAAWEGPSGAPPALVVLDGRLPGGRADGLARELASGEWSPVPVAWLGGPEDELAALAAGCTLFLGLPLDPEELVAHARALTESSESRHRLEEGLSRLRAQEYEQAAASFGEAGAGLLGTWARYHSGLARLEAGDQQAAAEELHALLDERPEFWRAHVQLARLYRAAGFEREAGEHLRQARELRPSLDESALAEPRPAAAPASEEAASPAPEEAAAPAPEAAARPVPAADGRPLVLLADDSELALAMIGAHLESAGYRVATAADGRQAIERAKELEPDLVILDGLMPVLNGFEACRAIKRELFSERPPPVILLSAIYTKQRQRTEAMSVYGADDLVPKSTDDAELIAAARRLCRGA